MSARHLQKPRQINIKDGTIGTALLVTLAFDSPGATGVSGNTSYVPPTSYAPNSRGSQARASSLPNSAEMTRRDYKPPDNQQKWNSLMMNCLLQLAQASLVEKDGVPFMPKLLGELYTPVEVRISSTALKNVPDKFHTHKVRFVVAMHDLMRVLTPEDQARWEEYALKHELNEDTEGDHSQAIQYFHTAQWFFANMPIEFQKNHVEEIANLSDILASWVTYFIEAYPQISNKAPSKISSLTKALTRGEYKPNMVKAFDEVTTYFIDHHDKRKPL
eukprot:Blabericola_migrator_1__464@NODE_1111_length_5406_cov_93_467129_g760_i0_p1_GENE_NODE_1111_length_5406_cov_93_467129_g760_i0NODE_1111_length_5406_cov_93_467129_g760_i0_p1_ORF_typecomplete_len274_score28_97_NODE_1111_length_5406_cov_93_467129_g760_i024845